MKLFEKVINRLAEIAWWKWTLSIALLMVIYGALQPGCCSPGIDSGEPAPVERWG